MIITIFDCCSSKVLTFCSLEHMDVNAATNSCYSNFSKVWWKQLLKELLENGFLWPKAVSLCLFMHGLAAPLWISYLSVQVLMQPWTLLFVSFCTSCWANSQSSSQLTHPLTWALIWGPLRPLRSQTRVEVRSLCPPFPCHSSYMHYTMQTTP